jgi:hypothetical protein
VSTKLRRLSVRSRVVIGISLLLLLSSGVWYNYVRWIDPPYSGPRWRRDQEEKVFEAVFRYQIAEHRHNLQVCFLSVRKSAPDPSLVRQFANLSDVVPISTRFLSQAGNYKDGPTGRAALHFWIDTIEWDSDIEARVEGGGAAANMSGDAGYFTVVWEHGKWKVIHYERGATF